MTDAATTDADAGSSLSAAQATVRIRRGGPDDAVVLRGLVRALAEQLGYGAAAVTASADDVRRRLGHPGVTYLIAEEGGRAVGYVSWLERPGLWSDEDYLALDDLYVVDDRRGLGVGELLMRATAREAAGRAIRWEVAEHNEGAQRFYRRLGATLVDKKICTWRPE